MKKNLSKITGISAVSIALCSTAITSQASVIIQWGDLNAGNLEDPNTDVTNATNGTQTFNTPVTYTGAATNPAVGAAYYPSATGRSPVFSTAGKATIGGTANLAITTSQIQENTSYDRIRYNAGNSSNFQFMAAWQSTNFLTADPTLTSLSHGGFRNNQGTTSFHFIVQTSSDAWFASEAFAWTGGGSNTGDFSIADAGTYANWVTFTPLTATAGGTSGTAGTINVTNVKSVGFYFAGTNATDVAIGAQSGYFQAQAVPEPSVFGLVGVAFAGLLVRRRH